MKRLNLNSLNVKTGVLLWFVVHAVLIALGVSVPWKMNSDLYSILPDSNETKNVSAAEKTLSARTMRNISVLVGHENFEVARAAAVALDSLLKDNSSLEETRLFVDENSLNETREFFYKNRYSIQGAPVREAVAAGDLESLKNNALQKIYGSFSMSDLNRLDEDPLLLGEASFDYFANHSPLSSGSFELRDGVLAATDSGITYVMWNAVLSENVSAMASNGHVLERLNGVLDSLKQANAGLVYAKSGAMFHSYESSNKAKSEIAWISGVSISLILLLLLFVYRSPLPIVATVSTIALSAFTALSFTWFVFENIHVFTFVFGTTVIGVSIDYAVHFFTSLKSGVRNVRSVIFKGLLLGFLTTELSYMALTFTEFPLLRQMAVFSMVGLLSSFLSITLLFHAVFDKRNQPEKKASATNLPMSIPERFLKLYSALPPKGVRLVLIVFALALIPGLGMLHVHTDLESLYSMSAESKAAESLAARLNNLGVSSNYFIVEGSSEQEVLEREELLSQRLAQAESDSLLQSHLALSNFIPSAKTQQATSASIKRLILDSANVLHPSVQSYLKEIGVQNDSLLVAGFSSEKMLPASLSDKLPSTLRLILQMLWIGPIQTDSGTQFYSAVLPLHVSAQFDAQAVAHDMPHVYAVNKIKNVNSSLTKISRMSLALVAIAYLVVFLVLVAVYKLSVALKIIRTPVLSSLFVAAFFGYAGVDFNFFAIVGVILTLGIGIDYALFFWEGGRNNLVTVLAVMLSAMTTLISFGSLVCSAFVPVSTFGFAVLLGIACCFLLSPLSAKH